jgi:hypothetical protein
MASDLMEAAMRERNCVKMIDEQRLTMMHDRGMIVEQADSASPFLTYYSFRDLATAQCFVYYATTRIGINQAISLATAILGTGDPSIGPETVELSRRIGRCIKYARRFKPLGCCSFVQPLVLAFQSCSQDERSIILDALYEFEEYKNPPRDRWSHDQTVLLCDGYDWKDLAGKISGLESQK